MAKCMELFRCAVTVIQSVGSPWNVIIAFILNMAIRITPDLSGSQCVISDPHSNAVVDLNGDCLADLFVVCDKGNGGKGFQIWINNKADGFELAQEGALPSDVQSITFADIGAVHNLWYLTQYTTN